MRCRLGRSGVVAVGAIGLLVVGPAASRVDAAAAKPGPYETIVVQTTGPTVRPPALPSLRASAIVAAPQNRYVMRLPAGDVTAALGRLRADGRVTYAEVAQPVHATGVPPDDPCFVGGVCLATCGSLSCSGLVNANQDYLKTIGAPAAWSITHGGGTVAVLDSGVDIANPDLAGKIRNNVNVCARDRPECSGSSDPLGHGTHVTGIVAAVTNNAAAVASLGWDVKVDMFKVLGSDGLGNTADVATAIYDAVAAGDRIINMSLANSSCAFDPKQCGPDHDEGVAVEYALAHNVVVVAAAGNEGLNAATYPASFPGVLSVAATNDTRAVQSFSQWGSAANISAPGFGIVSTWNDEGLAVLDGTSMAAPQVAAAGALMIAHSPSLSGPQVTELLESTARPRSGGHPINGGVLDVPAALAAAAHAPHLFNGYEMAGTDGSVHSFGSTLALGDTSGRPLSQPVVGIALRSDGLGYWMAAADGGVFSFGDARFHGSTGGMRLNRPVVGMAATPDGRGYWLVASDGGIFSFGDAGYHGSTGGIRLTNPAVGMSVTPSGSGYWVAASDGGVFSFGDARFWGSTGGQVLPGAIVGMSS